MHITSNDYVQLWEQQKNFQRLYQQAQTAAASPASDMQALVEESAQTNCAALQQQAHDFLGSARRVIWLGMGAASLAGQALAFWQSASVPMERPHMIFADGLDPEGLTAILKQPLAQTRIVVASRSGESLETLMQLDEVLEALKAAGLSPKTHIIGITGKGDNPLRARARASGFELIPHSLLGGRYALCSAVGLWPAIWAGMDIATFQKGFLIGLARHQQAALGAAQHCIAHSKGSNINMLFAFGAKFQAVGQWYLQLWAESLGKNSSASTPVFALAPRDLHSQWQLYLAGAADKFYTLLLCTQSESVKLTAAQMAMVQTELTRAQRPCRYLQFDGTSQGLGQVMGFWMLETILTANLLGVSPFGQPAVDASKRAVWRRLNAT